MHTADTTLGAPTRRVHRGRWIVAILAGCTVIAGINTWLSWKSLTSHFWGFMPRQIAIAEYQTTNVVGDLGGVPVTLPRSVARYVQYEGDPELGQRRLGPPPMRSHRSQLVSFGLQLRFPDMATTERYADWNDLNATPISSSNWIGVTVTSGRSYPGSEFLERLMDASIRVRGDHWFGRYSEVASSTNGLRAYAVEGIDPVTGRPWRTNRTAQDIFIARDSKGAVMSYITCDNSDFGSKCQQIWSMESRGMRAQVTAYYRRGLLDEWRSIQLTLTEKLMSYRHPAS